MASHWQFWGWPFARAGCGGLAIAAGQLIIALLLLVNRHGTRRLAVSGALAFLLGIAPLGVGSAFPFSLVYGSALVIMLLKLEHGKAA